MESARDQNYMELAVGKDALGSGDVVAKIIISKSMRQQLIASIQSRRNATVHLRKVPIFPGAKQ